MRYSSQKYSTRSWENLEINFLNFERQVCKTVKKKEINKWIDSSFSFSAYNWIPRERYALSLDLKAFVHVKLKITKVNHEAIDILTYF